MNAKRGFPGIGRAGRITPEQEAMTENIELLTGQTGDGSHRALLMKDLVDFDALKRQALKNSMQSAAPGNGALPAPPQGIERPHAPVNLQGKGGFTFITLTWAKPTYRGHAYAEVFRSDTNSFLQAVRIGTEVTDIYTDNVALDSDYYYWVRFVNIADVAGPTQGAEGLHVATQASAEQILKEIGGKIEASHLGAYLNAKIAEADGSGVQQDVERLAESLMNEAASNDLYADISRGNHAQVIAQQETVLTAQSALASQQTLLSTRLNAVSSSLATQYYTKSQADAASSRAATLLRSDLAKAIADGDKQAINNVHATLQQQYYTQSQINQARATALTALRSSVRTDIQSSAGKMMKNIDAKLTANYYTRSATNSAIAAVNTRLSSAISQGDARTQNVISANLRSNYFTKTDTQSAISQAQRTLKATIEKPDGSSVGAKLQTLSQTVAKNDANVWALWGVKTRVGDMTSSVALMNDGKDPMFVVKGAKFAVITAQSSQTFTPVFTVVGNRTVIAKALIDTAFIRSLVTDDLLANRVLVGSTLNTPSINYDRRTGRRSNNFSIDPNGVMFANRAELKGITIRDLQGNVVMSSSGTVPVNRIKGLGALAKKDSITMSSVTDAGPFARLNQLVSSNVSTYIASGAIGSAQIDAAWINELFGKNATFSGRVYAEKIEGDVYDAISKRMMSTVEGQGQRTVFNVSVSKGTRARKLCFGLLALNCRVEPISDEYAKVTIRLKYYRQGTLLHTSPRVSERAERTTTLRFLFPPVVTDVAASSKETGFKVVMEISTSGGHYTSPRISQPESCVVSSFFDGGSLS